MTIHVCGEGLVDLVPVAPGSLNDHTPALGGGPFNVAIAAARLGADVEFQSRLSTDGFGQELVGRLEAEGVTTTHLQRGNEPTTLAVTTIHEDGSASYNFYIEGTADRLVEPQLVPANIACFGTVSLALEPGASRYAQLLKDFAAQGTLVALDPNIRPFYATRQHREFLADLLPHVTVLKLSDEEVEFLGTDLISQAPVVVVTRGGKGLSVQTRNTELQVPAAKVTVADTIGAGDTIMAALLTQIDERGLDATALSEIKAAEWKEILSFAAAAAGITVSRKGANPPRREEVESSL
ncbi:carbohydrate kinase family protein [Corynebacterium diphtheriae]|uniref:carbohydrate kinase family protein n=1 Tax=Corynebacterium diphtheriae TaxID=1717 RepID=UPI000245B02F|nr:carbohydrate kinase [Corynebacterium diphtheriae]AEX42909.1 fructokinase [Corynebacterium diphtheriae 31A]AEX49716.1 fructokinase [Corynebacterium diphtheriae BH8]MBN4651801.1 carbohydrate kinase [Corynebacterium diphtheriae bv. mitis]MBN4654044.1 carbohydrate kinase [Corynebacterium diphtheriae bv. mitis]CAB0620161.1 carbohydrate kinase [Corynebacterium diphtheriae]